MIPLNPHNQNNLAGGPDQPGLDIRDNAQSFTVSKLMFCVTAVALAVLSTVALYFAAQQLYAGMILAETTINYAAAEHCAGLGILGLNTAGHMWDGVFPKFNISFSQGFGPVRVELRRNSTQSQNLQNLQLAPGAVMHASIVPPQEGSN